MLKFKANRISFQKSFKSGIFMTAIGIHAILTSYNIRQIYTLVLKNEEMLYGENICLQF